MSSLNIPLAIPDYGDDEINEVIDSLRSTYVTMGSKVKKFEQMWAETVGMKHAICVNSGSSANLLSIAMWNELGYVVPGDEVIVPATTWSTSIWPLIQYGLVPVFVDVDRHFTIDPESVRRAISPKTRAIMIVTLLGNIFDDELLEIVNDNLFLLMVDCCESHGATMNGKDVGAYGNVATWSFFMSHTLSTVEGGMICTNDNEEADVLRSLRAHGWAREISDKSALPSYLSPSGNFDERFLFLTVGYNVRPTEFVGAFGIHQTPKLEAKVKHRNQIVGEWTHHLERSPLAQWIDLPYPRRGGRTAWFGYPLIVRPNAPFSRKDLIDFLADAKIDTRPVMAADIRKHPAMAQRQFRSTETSRTDAIFERGFFVGLHTGIGDEHTQYFLDTLSRFSKKI